MVKKMLLICSILIIGITPSAYSNVSEGQLLNTRIVTNQISSYTGIENSEYTGDLGTRLYILPRDRVTSGVGGTLKIFGDAYHKGQSYRDLGIYFHQDQNGDTGTHGTGVFWINSKVEGDPYVGKYPDIGFGFQDGQFVAGRASVVNESPVFIFGKDKSKLAQISPDIRVEMQGNIALRNKDFLLWNTADGSRFLGLGADAQDRFKFSSVGGTTFYTNGVLKLETTESKTDIKNALVTSSTKSVTPSSTIDATGVNRIKLTAGGSISNIVGVNGQQVTILYKDDSATVAQSPTIKLQGAKSFTGGMDSTLVLENIEGVWYEISRSKNN